MSVDRPTRNSGASAGARIAGAHLGDVVVTHNDIRSAGWYESEKLSDELGRSGYVHAVAVAARLAAPGTVIAIEGPWGSGKTHVLASLTRELAADSAEAKALFWVNPWLHGDTNLLARVCELLLLDAVPHLSAEDGGPAAAPRDAHVGNADRAARDWTFKKLAVAISGGLAALGTVLAAGSAAAAGSGAAQFILAAGGPLQSIVETIVRTAGPAHEADRSLEPAGMDRGEAEVAGKIRASLDAHRDPVAELRAALNELTRIVRIGATVDPARPLLKLYVFIDDLDRCLPEVQVDYLRNLHFVTKTGASIVFIVAMDPRLLEDALRTHYRSKDLDAAGYVHKAFHVRAPLPVPESTGRAAAFVEALRSYGWPPNKEPSDHHTTSATAAVNTLCSALAEVTPRALARVAARVHLSVCGGLSLDDAISAVQVYAHFLWSEHAQTASDLLDIPEPQFVAIADGRNHVSPVKLTGQSAEHAPTASEARLNAALADGWLLAFLKLGVEAEKRRNGSATDQEARAAFRTTLASTRSPCSAVAPVSRPDQRR